MSESKYLSLYQKFINNTISKAEYDELLEWMKSNQDEDQLRKYMYMHWNVPEEKLDKRVLEWNDFIHKMEKLSQKDIKSKSIRKVMYMSRGLIAMTAVITTLILSYLVIIRVQNGVRTFETGFGETKYVTLEDGSNVILNANSSITWNKNWKRKNLRKICLHGEAYFEVVHLENESAFHVVTDDLLVKVLGTKFNVRSRNLETGVFLESGKIHVSLEGNLENEMELKPGDKLEYSSKSQSLIKSQSENTETDLDWINGILRFEDVSVREMFEIIHDLYGKSFNVDDELILNRRLYTGIPYEDWPVVLKSIELSLGLKFEERNNELEVVK